MENRYFEKIGQEVSLLGFGCMRLPRIKENRAEIDEQTAQKMIDRAIEMGVNYFDTAYMYHDGLSEKFIGGALKKYPRDSFFLATKMPVWDYLGTIEDAERIFQEQLERCQVEYFDFYLIHSLNTSNFQRAEQLGLYDMLKQKKQEGKIRHLGFSFHDNPVLLEAIVAAHEWDFAQIQLNYLDWEAIDSKRQYEILENAGIPVIIMEPVRGGCLANLGPAVDKILKTANPTKSAASWAIRFAASLPQVMTVLSGMSTMEQVEDNLETISHFEPLSEEERTILKEAIETYCALGTIPCTGCRYCMDCPEGVEIPRIFSIYNHYLWNKNKANFNDNYKSLLDNQQAHHCIRCGKCEKHCPQGIEIPQLMKEIAQFSGIKSSF